MILSSLESLFLRFLLSAALDCNQRRRYAEIKPYMDELLAWCRLDGVTPDAQAEIDAGEPVRKL